jgi:hypothetical protein
VAEWLRNGLQNRVHQFNSGRGLHQHHQVVAQSFSGKALVMPRPPVGRSGRPGRASTGRSVSGPERACEITPWEEGSVSVSSPEVFPPKLDRRNHPAATVILRQCTLVGQSPNRSEFAAARSAGGVPALGKRQQRPGQPIVVGGFRRLIEYRLIAQEVLLGRGRNGRSYGIQQQIEFSFAHRALLRFERVGSQNSFVSGLSE